MSNIARMMQRATAGAGGATLDVDDVFSTFLTTGANSTIVVNSGIDLASEGGLVWQKTRSTSGYNILSDTERGPTKYLVSNTTDAEATANQLSSFNSNGHTIGNASNLFTSGVTGVSWTFRKAPKFFDVITYSGNSTAGRTISHNLGCTVGQVWVKRTSHTNNWICWHRGIANNKYLQLNSNSPAYADGGIFWNNTTPSSTTVTLGSDSGVNATGSTYVMYVFAHNNNDGGFGPDSDQDIIKCGSISGFNGRAELGFEPQWLLIKETNFSSNWVIYDVMRGWVVGSSNDAHLWPHLNNAEGDFDGPSFDATGFNYGQSGENWIYMAIRRGPLAVPDDATKVFAIDTQGSTGDGAAPAFRSTFPIDTIYKKSTAGGGTTFASRLTGTKFLRPESNNAESSNSQNLFDFMNGGLNNTSTYAPNYGYMWKRAPGYFDVVCYTGTGVAGRTVNHNLGVAPEMMWIKQRDGAGDWEAPCDYTDTTFRRLQLSSNGGSAAVDYTSITSDGSNPLHNKPTATQIILNSAANVNQNTKTYIAYLFATVAGVSKVGSYTGSGATKTIDCGFSSGARFVLIKRTDASNEWYIFDTVRGITTTSNDGVLRLNSNQAQYTEAGWVGVDMIQPDNSGFKLTSNVQLNANTGTYIFYAIA